MKKTATLILLFIFAMCVAAQTTGTAKHEVLTGETLSSIARSHGTTVKELLRLNPSLNPDYVMAGQRINVPAPANASQHTTAQHQAGEPAATARPRHKTTHMVQKKETIYSVSRMYGISEEQLIAANPELRSGKLKKGAVLNIPYSEAELATHAEADRKAKAEADERRRQEELAKTAVNAAVILPFALGDDMTAEAQKMANLYQGFLLAADTLKRQGYNINIYAYDENGQGIHDILDRPAMKNMSLIVGPVRSGNAATVADFAKRNGITHVVPMVGDASLVNSRPHTFQLNVAGAVLYPLAGAKLASMHAADNIVFLDMGDASDNSAFTAEAKRACNKAGKAYKTATFANLREQLDTDRQNVIVPSASSASAFGTLCTRLNIMTADEPGMRIQLFGYPEWQALSAKQHANLTKYSCQYFTPFHHNPSSPAIRSFEARFQRWFRQPQYNSLPRYGEMGYDIGIYFLNAAKACGKDISSYAGSHTLPGRLAFPMQFERKGGDGNGWQNISCLIVQHRADGTTVVK